MKVLCLLIITTLIYVVTPQLIGICMEECSPNIMFSALNILGCPAGYECRSNGCGHTCQPATGKRACTFVACGIYCPFGQKVVNGCTLCSCNPDPFSDLIGAI